MLYEAKTITIILLYNSLVVMTLIFKLCIIKHVT